MHELLTVAGERDVDGERRVGPEAEGLCHCRGRKGAGERERRENINFLKIGCE